MTFCNLKIHSFQKPLKDLSDLVLHGVDVTDGIFFIFHPKSFHNFFYQTQSEEQTVEPKMLSF